MESLQSLEPLLLLQIRVKHYRILNEQRRVKSILDEIAISQCDRSFQECSYGVRIFAHIGEVIRPPELARHYRQNTQECE